MTGPTSTQPITIMSSYSDDILINTPGKIIAIQKGGPAAFIEQAIRGERLPYKLFSGKRIEVEILVTPNGEYGKVTAKPCRRSMQDYPLTDWTIVSTILDEWQLAEPYPEKMFVDLQGYLRDGIDFGKKRTNETVNRLAGNVFCLKGTKEEVSYLPKMAQVRQKQRLLVVTNGNKEIMVFNKGKLTNLNPRKVYGLNNTIGAGDTFLACFVAAMYRGDAPEPAAAYAAGKTTDFLLDKS